MIGLIRNLAAQQHGAISILTLAFLLLVGIVSLIFLWLIAALTGAYNTLYIANQNAAIAAASTANSDQALGQPSYLCTSPGRELTDGSQACAIPTNSSNTGESIEAAPAIFAAKTVMEQSLLDGSFSLQFSGPDKNVQLIPPPGTEIEENTEYIMLYNIATSKGQIEDIMRRDGLECLIPENRYWGRLNGPGIEETLGDIQCWQVRERGVTFAKQYTSGVITRARAQFELFPGCPLDFCQSPEIIVTAAATVRQLSRPENWDDFYFIQQ